MNYYVALFLDWVIAKLIVWQMYEGCSKRDISYDYKTTYGIQYVCTRRKK